VALAAGFVVFAFAGELIGVIAAVFGRSSSSHYSRSVAPARPCSDPDQDRVLGFGQGELAWDDVDADGTFRQGAQLLVLYMRTLATYLEMPERRPELFRWLTGPRLPSSTLLEGPAHRDRSVEKRHDGRCVAAVTSGGGRGRRRRRSVNERRGASNAGSAVGRAVRTARRESDDAALADVRPGPG